MNAFWKEKLNVRRESLMAVVFSILAHIGAVALLYAFTANTDLSRINSDSGIIHITWVQPANASDIKVADSYIDTRDNDSRREQPHQSNTKMSVAEMKPALPKRHERKEENNKRDDNVISAVTTVHQTPARTASRPVNTQVVALAHSRNTHEKTGHERGAVIARPRYGENARPNYPLSARMKGHEGVVFISAEILAEGRVGSIKIKTTSGYTSLDQSALEAVKNWKFEPGKKLGKPITMWVDIPVRYVLNKTN